jgi:predicted DNA-binding transcriptional regulator AlpA
VADLLTLEEIARDPAAAAQLPAEARARLLARALAVVGALAAPAVAVNGGPPPEPREPDRLLTAEEAAQMLGAPPAWLRRHPRLPFVRKLGHRTVRFSEAGIRRWLAARRP